MRNFYKYALYIVLCVVLIATTACGDDNLTGSGPKPTGDYYIDGESVTYQKATTGKGISIIFIGDGFTQEDFLRKNSRYQQIMEECAEYLFEVEPYKSFRDHFNVYWVAAISQQEGISKPNQTVKSCFGARYSGSGTAMTANTVKCFEYALKSPMKPYIKGVHRYEGDDQTIYKCREALVVLVTNSTQYGGTTLMYNFNSAVAICALSGDYGKYRNLRGLIQHEAGGHGFGKLTDEYTTLAGPPTEHDKEEYAQWVDYGFFANADTTNLADRIKWRHFYDLNGYEAVGAYEGSNLFARGMWRPERNSCMIENMPYYNAPSRQEIYRRIMQYSGKKYSLEEFLEYDKRNINRPLPKGAMPLESKEMTPEQFRPTPPQLITIEPLGD